MDCFVTVYYVVVFSPPLCNLIEKDSLPEKTHLSQKPGWTICCLSFFFFNQSAQINTLYHYNLLRVYLYGISGDVTSVQQRGEYNQASA